jgi:flagellar hook-basal body complex protein FliE
MIPRNNGYYQGMPGATMQESTTIHQTECHDDDVSEVLKQICNDTEELVTLAGETLEAMQATRRNMRSVIYAMEEPDGVKEERIRKARLHSSVSV